MAPPRQNAARNLTIRHRAAVGESMQSIGADYGLTRQRIHQIIRQPDITPRQAEWDARNAAIRRDYAAGRRQTEELAAEYGITPRRVRYIVRDLCADHNAARRAEVRRLRADGWSVRDIAAQTGYHRISIYYILNYGRY